MFADLIGSGSSAFIETGSESLTPYMYLVAMDSNLPCIRWANKDCSGAETAPSGVYHVSQDNLNMGSVATALFQKFAGDAFLWVLDNNEAADTVQWTSFTGLMDNFTSYQPSGSSGTNAGGFPNWAPDCNDAAADDMVTVATAIHLVTPAASTSISSTTLLGVGPC